MQDMRTARVMRVMMIPSPLVGGGGAHAQHGRVRGPAGRRRLTYPSPSRFAGPSLSHKGRGDKSLPRGTGLPESVAKEIKEGPQNAAPAPNLNRFVFRACYAPVRDL